MSPKPLHEDDSQRGRLLSRREALTLFGGAGAALLLGGGMIRLVSAQSAGGNATPVATPGATGTAVPACVVRPALSEGPYFVETGLDRSDIRIEPTDGSVKDGAMLKLRFRVFDVSGGMCAPLEGAMVDVWHCDADGVYSGVRDRFADTRNLRFLRGYQMTDQAGEAAFTTIYPGWYPGRTVHIHFKIRTDPQSAQGYDFTSQLFFDDAYTDVVYEQPPYNERGTRNTRNSQDGIYRGSEGLLTLDVLPNEDAEEGGYQAVFSIGLDLRGAGATASGPGASGAAGWPGNA
jgi:protocatechuate 3,4-dioxygenase beta subunit